MGRSLCSRMSGAALARWARCPDAVRRSWSARVRSEPQLSNVYRQHRRAKIATRLQRRRRRLLSACRSGRPRWRRPIAGWVDLCGVRLREVGCGQVRSAVRSLVSHADAVVACGIFPRARQLPNGTTVTLQPGRPPTSPAESSVFRFSARPGWGGEQRQRSHPGRWRRSLLGRRDERGRAGGEFERVPNGRSPGQAASARSSVDAAPGSAGPRSGMVSARSGSARQSEPSAAPCAVAIIDV